MLRALKFILIAAVFLALAWWIGGLPGDVTAHSGRYTVQTSVPAAILVLVLIALLLTVLFRVLGGLRRAPGGITAWRGGRRQKLGEIALQRGIVALAAGDAPAAQAEASHARKLIGDNPLVLLLTAESARLAGQAEQARAAFAQLTTHKEMAFLGHHGLLRHHVELGDPGAAQSHALAAEDAYPGSAALRTQRLDLAVAQQNYGAALALTKNPAQVAALATAAAQTAPDKRRALAYAKQAVKADPTLAPAVVAYANALRALGKPRAAGRALLAGWKASPNPLIASAYLSPLATPIERAQAASELEAARPGHPESELVLGETALAARLTGEARRHANAAVTAGASNGRAEAILAALDGKQATNSPSLWVCTACHASHADWSPVCPQCHAVGTLK